MSGHRPRRPSLWPGALLLVVLVAAVYWPALRSGFVFDDEQYLTVNAHVRGGLTAAGVRWAFTSFHAANWHPLTWLSHMLDATVWGMSPAGHHLTSLVLHAANGVLMFAALAVMTGAWWRSLLVAALFAVHPLHVESVAWVAERKDVLSTLFGLLGVVSYARYARGPGWGRYGAVAGCLALSLMSKPMLVTFPFLLLLLDYWPLGRIGTGSVERSGTVPVPGSGGAEMEAGSASMGTGSVERSGTVPVPGSGGAVPVSRRWGWLILEKIPLLLLAAASSAVTFLAQRQVGAVVTVSDFPFRDRLANALLSYARYLAKMFWPAKLAFFYPRHEYDYTFWVLSAAALPLLALSVAAWRWRRPYLTMGWLWYLGMLVPVIGLVQVGSQSMADRYTYLPLTGPFIALAWGAGELAAHRRAGPGVRFLPAAVIVAALSVAAFVQVGYWRDSLTIYGHALDVTEGNWMGHNNLGVNLDRMGRTDEAVHHYYRALQLNAGYADAHYNLGLVFLRRGDLESARSHFLGAVWSNKRDVDAHFKLGETLVRMGRDREAIVYLRQAANLSPGDVEILAFLGEVLLKDGRAREALPHLADAARLSPGDMKIRWNLSQAQRLAGR